MTTKPTCEVCRLKANRRAALIAAIALCISLAAAKCAVRAQAPSTRTPDDKTLGREGLRHISAKHLALLTDLPASDDVEALPAAFDQAVPQWANYFGVEPANVADWRLVGYLIKEKEPFQRLGLLSERVPAFDHGYSIDREFWLFAQTSTYYQRHLLLHEATHSFMNTLLGGCGPDWYMEGIAELLATHHMVDGQLFLNRFPRSREEVPYWGRIKLVRDAVAAGQSLSLDQVRMLRPASEPNSLGYAWCWALAALLDGNPKYRERFRGLSRYVTEVDFDEQFRRLYAEDWNDLCFEWSLFAADLTYGYDFERAAVEFAPPIGADSQDGATVRCSIKADRGWQSTAVRLDAGQSYRISAKGDFQLAAGPTPWPCGPDGVTIHYHQGRPLGQLLAVLQPESNDDETADNLSPIPIGGGATIEAARVSKLYLKINESPAKLADNQGSIEVEIRRD